MKKFLQIWLLTPQTQAALEDGKPITFDFKKFSEA